MQKLTLHHLDGSIAAELGADTDRALLASYGPLNGWEVRVHDSDAGCEQPVSGGAPSERVQSTSSVKRRTTSSWLIADLVSEPGWSMAHMRTTRSTCSRVKMYGQ